MQIGDARAAGAAGGKRFSVSRAATHIAPRTYIHEYRRWAKRLVESITISDNYSDEFVWMYIMQPVQSV